MSIKERLQSYVPFFHHYYLDEIIESYDNETIVRVKKDNYEQTLTYMKVISIYGENDHIEQLEQQAQQMKLLLDVSDEDYLEYEQYLIEDEQDHVIGIDICALFNDKEYENIDIEEIDENDLYQVGLYYYDLKRYDRALECFRIGEENEDSDCLCIIGYMYEKGYGLEKNIEMAREYYELSSRLGNVVAACNLAYFYENVIAVVQNYQNAFELYSMGERENFPRSLYAMGYCLQF